MLSDCGLWNKGLWKYEFEEDDVNQCRDLVNLSGI